MLAAASAEKSTVRRKALALPTAGTAPRDDRADGTPSKDLGASTSTAVSERP